MSIFFKLLVLDVLISSHCNVNYEAGLFFIVDDQHNVEPTVKQIFVSLDGKVPDDIGVVIPDHFFWFYPPVLNVLKIVLSTYGPVYY